MRIALLNIDPEEADVIGASLAAVGHACQIFSNDKELLDHLPQEGFAMLIMDGPMASGAAMHAVRERQASLPVMFLTGRGCENDIVAAMKAGADDYLVRPLRRGELVTRVQALLKRAYPGHESEQIRFGRYAFEPHIHRLTRDAAPIEVTQKEFELALLFFRHLGRPLSRAYLQEAVWTRETELPSRTVDTHVSRVRSKLGLRPENGFRLVPVYSYGYRLEQLAQ
jgi:DNA-binding response OmpR family regulator